MPDDEEDFDRKRRRSKSVKRKKQLTGKEFQALMSKDALNFTLVRPVDIRQRFTEYVMRNHEHAMQEQTLSALHSEAFFQNESYLASSKRERLSRRSKNLPSQSMRKKRGDPRADGSLLQNSMESTSQMALG